MSKQITGAEYPISKIFSSDFDYTIPSYQRPYAWTVDQASELFDDLYDFYKTEDEDSYFLGSIVLIKEEGKPRSEVIDGQQRLTTLTILISALASMLSGELKSDFENYIREPGRASQGLKPKPRLSLRERDREFFAKYVQGLKFEDLLGLNSSFLENESQKNIQSNSCLMINSLNSKFSGDKDLLCKFGAFIVQRCFLVSVSTPSQKSAFRVFSVMNSRGLDLLPTDIIKADTIGLIDEDKQNSYNERWEDLEVQIGRSDFNDLFYYIRMIYAKVKAKRALLEEFKTHVLSRNIAPEEFIENVLEPYAEAYQIAKNQQYESTDNAKEINALLRWLNRIDNSDWLPPAIMFLSQHKDDTRYTFWFFQKLERLAAYLHICGKNINQRIVRYSFLLNEMDQAEDHCHDAPLTSIELTSAEKEEMMRILDSNIYELTARRRNYTILRLDSFMSDAAATYDHSLLTIEHVLPQTVSEGSDWLNTWPEKELRDQWIHKLANLVPLNQKRNSKAQNYDFKTKKTAYFGGKSGVSSYVLTTQVLNTDEWTPEKVAVRQKSLLEVLQDKWELNGTVESAEIAS